jgi:peptide-methionine (S)-S-oxide reductase
VSRVAVLAALAASMLLAAGLVSCDRRQVPPENPVPAPAPPPPPGPTAETRLATFGGGCFWCVEALFERLEGVVSVESGYAGGSLEKPTYKQVCRGDTGHAEVVQVRYDPAKVTYEALLEVFFKTHDPTTPNRQGADEGTQYRSIVLYHDEEQRRVAESVKRDLDASGAFDAPIVTQIVPYDGFWRAEDYHQGYYDANASQPYCQTVIAPKVKKLEKVFRDRLKRP